MLATKQFKSALGLIRKYDETMKSTLSACYAYCLWQWHNGKNKNPHGELVATLNEAKGFLSEIAPKLTLGKRDAALNEAQCIMRADIVIGDLFRGREAKKAERAESKRIREAKQAEIHAQNEAASADVEVEHAAVTPDSMVIEGEAVAVEVEHALVIDGSVVTLSQAEVIALRDYLTELRTPTLKAA